MHTDIKSPTRLVLRRTFTAPRDRVFAAFTQAGVMSLWMGPGDFRVSAAESDARPGGAYRVTMTGPDGDALIVRGTYETVTPERLAYTWSWAEDDPKDEIETLVTIELRENGAHTDVILTQEHFKTEQSRDNHVGGWSTSLDQLQALLEK